MSSTTLPQQRPRLLHETQAAFCGKVGPMPSEMPKKPVRYGGAAAIVELAAENAKGRAAGTGRRSSLYLWLYAHHDQLAAVFAQNGPSWARIANHLGKNGVVGDGGDPPAPETVRSAWYRVRRDVAAARARRAGSGSASASASVDGIMPPTVASSPPPDASPQPFLVPARAPAGEPDRRPRRFGLAQPRGHRLSAPPLPASIPDPERIQRSPEEVERIVADMMSGAPNNPFRHDKGD